MALQLQRILSTDISINWPRRQKCSVCFDVFSFNNNDLQSNVYGKAYRPHILSCYHNVCQNCISNKKVIKCGTCGIVTKSDLSKRIIVHNFYLNGLLHYVDNDLKAILDYDQTKRSLKPMITQIKNEQECNECSSDTNYYCVQCCAPYCRRCFTRIHTTAKALRKHNYTLLGRRNLNLGGSTGNNKIQNDNRIKKCKNHPNKCLEYYCNDCYGDCCSLCITTEHLNHEVKTIQEKNNDYIPIVKNLLHTVKLVRDKARVSIKVSQH